MNDKGVVIIGAIIIAIMLLLVSNYANNISVIDGNSFANVTIQINNTDDPTLARIGVCPDGFAVQNTTNAGVQCINVSGMGGSSTNTSLLVKYVNNTQNVNISPYNVSASRFIGNISCSMIDGGSDSNYCVDSNDGGINQSFADATYLRLDTTNDPIDKGLEIRNLTSSNLTLSSVASNYVNLYREHALREFNISNVVNSGIGYAGLFDGVDDFATVTDNARLEPTKNVTWSVWLYPTGAGSNADEAYVFIKGIRAGVPYVHYAMTYLDPTINGDGKRALYMFYYNSTGATAGLLRCGATKNDWTHAVFVKNSTTFACYINGALYNSTTILGDIVYNVQPNENMIIGAANFGGSFQRRFQGRIDELHIWNKTLTPTEVSQLYALGQGLVGNLSYSPYNDSQYIDGWTFNENGGSRYDSVKQIDNATISNGATWIQNNIALLGSLLPNKVFWSNDAETGLKGSLLRFNVNDKNVTWNGSRLSLNASNTEITFNNGSVRIEDGIDRLALVVNNTPTLQLEHTTGTNRITTGLSGSTYAFFNMQNPLLKITIPTISITAITSQTADLVNYRIANGSLIGAVDANGKQVIGAVTTANARLNIYDSAEQIRLGVSPTIYESVTMNSTGSTTYDLVGGSTLLHRFVDAVNVTTDLYAHNVSVNNIYSAQGRNGVTVTITEVCDVDLVGLTVSKQNKTFTGGILTNYTACILS